MLAKLLTACSCNDMGLNPSVDMNVCGGIIILTMFIEVLCKLDIDINLEMSISNACWIVHENVEYVSPSKKTKTDTKIKQRPGRMSSNNFTSFVNCRNIKNRIAFGSCDRLESLIIWCIML